MGKKIWKAARNALMENLERFCTASPTSVLQVTISANNTAANEDSVGKETETCPHLDNGINLKNISIGIVSVECLSCEDCRKGAGNKLTKKGKNKQGNNEVNGSEAEAIWVCLECSHFSCGGIGLPTIPNSHAAQHAKEYRHPLALQYTNPKLIWCFPCNALIPVQNFTENEGKDSLSKFIEILKTHSSSLPVTCVGRDRWFESGSCRSRFHLANTLPHRLDNTGGYMVRGLMNSGNTCFFNSILQNLLAIDKLREHLLEVDGVVGPLTTSLKNFFIEMSPSAGVKYVINPTSLFDCVCMKSPQFKGVQQQDSHELLHFLLDGLSTEESHVITRSQDGNSTLKHASTFVDNIFGGQISSTLSCLECGHASVVYEPYLDLSLPLPAKKVPPKMTAPVSRSKKPPMMQGRFWPKNKKKYYQCRANISTSKLTMEIEENAKSSGDSILSESPVLDSAGDINDSALLKGTKHDATNISTSEDAMSIDEITTSSGDSALLKGTKHDANNISTAMSIDEVATSSGDSALLKETKHDATNISTSEAAMSVDEIATFSGDSALQSNQYFGTGNKVRLAYDAITMSEAHDLAVRNSLLVFNGHDTTTYLGDGDDIVNGTIPVSFLEDYMQIDSIDEGETWSGNFRDCVFTDEDMLSHNQDYTLQEPSDSDAFDALYDVPGPTVRHEPSNFDAFSRLYDVPGPTVRHEPSNFDAFSRLYDDPIPISNHHDIASLLVFNGHDTTTHLGDGDEIVNGTIPISFLEADMQVDSIDKGETWSGNFRDCVFTDEDMLSHNQDYTLQEPSDSDAFETLYDVPGPTARHEPSDFDDLYDDPIFYAGPSVIPFSNRYRGSGYMATSCSDSDPDEVNDLDSSLSVEKCLANFTTSELLPKTENAWQCEQCAKSLLTVKTRLKNEMRKPVINGHEMGDSNASSDSKSVKVVRDASKRIMISRAPQVLTIHLKRFRQYAHGQFSKLNGHVNFEETLDLKPYMDPSVHRVWFFEHAASFVGRRS